MKAVALLMTVFLGVTSFAQTKRVEIIKEYDGDGNLVRVDSNVYTGDGAEAMDLNFDFDELFKEFGDAMGDLSMGFDQFDSVMKFEFPEMKQELMLGFDEMQKQLEDLFSEDNMKQMEDLLEKSLKESQEIMKNMFDEDFLEKLEEMQKDMDPSTEPKTDDGKKNSGKKTNTPGKTKKGVKTQYY